VQPNAHAAWSRVLRDSLELKQAAATHNRGFDLLKFIPAVHATVRIENFS
jgi:hypothetical protein